METKTYCENWQKKLWQIACDLSNCLLYGNYQYRRLGLLGAHGY